jgi:hypothetical protein
VADRGWLSSAGTVIASDGHGGAASIDVPWTISPTPNAVQLSNPGNQSSSAGESVSLQMSASDLDGNSLYYPFPKYLPL